MNLPLNPNDEQACLSLTVSQPDDSGTWTVIVGWVDALSGRARSYGVLCAYSELPSVLCEVVHEVTGSIILASDGAFG